MDVGNDNGDMDVDRPSENAIPSNPIHATRTEPVQNNKIMKRLGAEKAKKLEIEHHAEHALRPEEATMYRDLIARCNYRAQDRARSARYFIRSQGVAQGILRPEC